MHMPKVDITLKLITKWPRFRALAWYEDCLYASSGYRLYKLNFNTKDGGAKNQCDGYNISRELIGFYRPDLLRNLAARNRLTNRMLRTGFHCVSFLNDGRIVAILAKTIAVLDPGETRFRRTWKVQRGNRPRGTAVTPEGWIFWGEYFRNPGRDPVHVYGSYDRGETWDVVYTFPIGSIKHVHNILYDKWEDCLWMITGDERNEPKILRVSKDWSVIDVVREGTQQDRAATMIITQDDIYYATDTPHEQNHIYRMNKRNGNVQKIASTSGPAMWSCKSNGAMFFSSAAEPGRYYYPAACIWGSKDGNFWNKLIEWQKDALHPRFFQYGNVILPKGETQKKILAATGMAVNEFDQHMVIWKVV